MNTLPSSFLAAAVAVLTLAPGAFGQSEGDLRLVDGANPRIGRLEIFHSGVWGTVCDDFFDDVDAGVACRQLGYGDGVEQDAYGASFPGVDPIWMDNVQCLGGEASLSDCSFNGFGSHNCVHFEDVAVHCSGCPASPELSCETGFGKAKLDINEKAPGREKLSVTLQKGPLLDTSDMGDPLGTSIIIVEPDAAYSVCIYDDFDNLVGELDVTGSPAFCGNKPCWKETGPTFSATGLVYSDKGLSEDGVQKIKIKAGLPGQSKIQVKGKNNAKKGIVNLPSIAPLLAGSTSTTVQFYTDEGGCYSATLTDVKKNDFTAFSAKN